jgi:hypothetical protein
LSEVDEPLPNDDLRSARLCLPSATQSGRSMSRQELADAVNKQVKNPIDDKYIGKLERGEIRWPRPERRAALRIVLGVDHDADIGLHITRSQPSTTQPRRSRPGVDRGRARTSTGSTGGDSSTTARSPDLEHSGYTSRTEPSDVLERVSRFVTESDPLAPREADYHRLVKDLVEWARRMKRRDILQWLSWAAAAAAVAPVLDGLDAQERERTVQALVAPRRVDSAVIDHIEAVLWRCMRQDDTLGPQSALDTVLAQRALLRTLLAEAPEQTRDRLLSLYANTSRFAGWLAFDLNNYAAASDYYEAARTSAHEAHNTELGAFVLCNMSHLAGWRGQPRVGIDHAIAAQAWANQTDDLQLQAYAYDVAARSLAMDGQAQAAMAALESARTVLDRADHPSPWVYFFNEGQLGSTESACHLYLGNPERAAQAAEQALTSIGGSFVRNLALATLRLGIARLRGSKPDVAGGAEAIGDAVQLAAHNRSARVVDQLHRGWRELEPWSDQSEVRQVRNQLASCGVG